MQGGYGKTPNQHNTAENQQQKQLEALLQFQPLVVDDEDDDDDGAISPI